MSRAYLGDTKVLFFVPWCGFSGVTEDESGAGGWDPSVKGLKIGTLFKDVWRCMKDLQAKSRVRVIL